MTPKETTILKGVAILFMLYLHLFNSMNQVELCTNLICIGGIPLAHILSRCTNPVAIYLLLSGYGLYKTRERLTARNTSRRLAKLYIHYWISMGLFVAIGSVIAPEKYPGTLSDFIVNLTSWHTTYNIQIWFLLPYAIMILTAPYLFELFEKKPVITLGAAAMLWGGEYVVMYLYGNSYLYTHRFAFIPVVTTSFILPFLIGAAMARYGIFERFRTYFADKKMLLAVMLVAVPLLRISTDIDFITQLLFVTLFLPLFIAWKRPQSVDRFLTEMGNRSTSMWFVHSYFCYYLFHDFIYGFRYPAAIFLVLLAASYAAAIVVDRLNGAVQKRIFHGKA